MDDADAPPHRLCDDFAPANRDQWLAMVEKTLKGASLETLTRHGPDGLPVMALYTPDDLPNAGRPAAARWRRAEKGWDVRVRVPTGPDANAAALEALSGGATSLLCEAHDGGATLSAALVDVVIETAPVALDAGFAGVAAATALDLVAKASPAARLAFHLDPLGAWAEGGASPGPVDAHLAAAAGMAARLAQTYPRASLFLASGAPAHEAGGAAATELAFAAAAAVAYAKALTSAGLSLEGAWSRIVLALTVDAEPIAAIVKLRAARLVWARLAGACGLDTPAHIEARSSRRMLTRTDVWTNLVRLTAAAFGAAAGGADAIVLDPFTEALGDVTDPVALRQARNIQLVLMEEAHLADALDPAGGAFAFEAQTDALARLAWSRFAAIEAAGGLAAALREGLVSRAVRAEREALASALRGGEQRIVGVTDYRPDDSAPPAPSNRVRQTAAARLPGPDSLCPALTPIRDEDLAR
jgi:methylmalonyl-CoA mutase